MSSEEILRRTSALQLTPNAEHNFLLNGIRLLGEKKLKQSQEMKKIPTLLGRDLLC